MSLYTLNCFKNNIDKKQLAEAEHKYKAKLLSASTLNPKYDKRWKNGEDAVLISNDNKFICALDGVGGWIDLLIDSGTMTKELINHIQDSYNDFREGKISEFN